MANARQTARVRINSLIDEIVADLRGIKRHTLHMDKPALEVIKRRSATRIDMILAIYDVLDAISLPAEKLIVPDEELDLK